MIKIFEFPANFSMEQRLEFIAHFFLDPKYKHTFMNLYDNNSQGIEALSMYKPTSVDNCVMSLTHQVKQGVTRIYVSVEIDKKQCTVAFPLFCNLCTYTHSDSKLVTNFSEILAKIA